MSDLPSSSFFYECRFKREEIFSKKRVIVENKKNIASKDIIYCKSFYVRKILYAQIWVSAEVFGHFCDFDYKTRSPKAYKFIKNEILMILKEYSKVHFKISTKYSALFNVIRKKGYYAYRLNMYGKTNDSFQSLEKSNLKAFSTNIKKVKMKKGDIDDSLKLLANTFPLKRRHIQGFKKSLINELKKEHAQYVLKDEHNYFRGHLGLFIYESFGLFGKCAGFHLFLDETLRGKGHLRYIYYELLKELKKRKVRVYFGSTSVPAVIKLSSEMNRTVSSITFTKEKPTNDIFKLYKRFLD